LKPRQAPAIAISGMDFSYTTKEIFRGVDLALAPGTIYRLVGDNGAGKTTLLKLLVGVLAPSRGTFALDGAPYEPRHGGNRAFALATQNPDHQWCGATLREDVARRRNALSGRGIALPADEALAIEAGAAGREIARRSRLRAAARGAQAPELAMAILRRDAVGHAGRADDRPGPRHALGARGKPWRGSARSATARCS